MTEKFIQHLRVIQLSFTFSGVGFKDRPNYSVLRALHSTTDRQVYKAPVVFRLLNQFLLL